MDRYELTAIAAILAVIAGLGWASYAVSAAACSSQWEGAFPSEFRFFGGCMIEVAPGKWIPADNYREVTP